MADYSMYDFPGRTIVLGYPPQGDSLKGAAFILNVMDELKDIMMPLCASISLDYYNKKTLYRDKKVRPKNPFHNIYNSSVPERVVVKLSSDKSISTETETLSKNTILAWIENAMRQESPQPETHKLILTQLNFEAFRAKIHDDYKLKKQKFMTIEHDRRGYFKFPLEKQDDGLWVYSPIEDLETEPSFVIRSGESLKIDIHIHWQWWTRESPKDRDALEEALLRIIANGCTLEFLSDSLKKPLKRLTEHLN